MRCLRFIYYESEIYYAEDPFNFQLSCSEKRKTPSEEDV